MAAMLWAHLHAWTNKRQAESIEDLGVHTYHEKSSGTKDDICTSARQKWAESRGLTWMLKNKRPERLKENLVEVEELIQVFQIVQVKWSSSRFVQILLNNCALISFMIAKNSGDVEKIFIDKSLCSKITEKINSGVWTEEFMLLSFCDKSKICCVNFSRKIPTDFRRIDKLAALEPKVTFVDLPGQAGRRLNRSLSINITNDMASVWWSLASEEAWPWSPVAGDRARANVIIIGVNGGKFDVLAYLRTECDPIHASFSTQNPHHILTIESTPKSEGDNSIDSCIYEFHKNAVKRVSVISIPLKAAVSCLAWNRAEDKLLLGCKDKTLVLYDCHRLVTQITSITFVPWQITWHPAGSVVFIFSLQGDIKVFDMALAPVLIQLAAESMTESRVFRMSEHFRDVKLSHAKWSCDCPLHSVTDGDVSCSDNLFIVFQDRSMLCNLRIELGSLTLGRLGPRELIEEYIKHNQAEQAVNFVNSINWNADGNSCFVCLSAVMNYLLKFPLTDEREGLLEETLGCFYTPSRPINDVVVLQYRDPLSRWSRKFFYHLIRYRRFQKAFRLAVDIGAADLFMDMHFVALESGNIALAENAKNKALEIDSELLSTESDNCSEYDERISLEENVRIESDPFNEPYAVNYDERLIIEQDNNMRSRDHRNVDASDEGFDEKVSQDEGNARGRAEANNQAVVEIFSGEHEDVDGPVYGEHTRETEQNEGSQPEMPVNHQNTLYLPLNPNITQNPDVWALAHNIELVTAENEEEDVIYL